MIKYISIIIVVCVLAVGFAGGVEAQVMATMPTLYNQAGTPVNTGTGRLAAGYYYLQPGGVGQIYYYGDGTFYNPATNLFGGSVSNPNGTAGVTLNYATTGTVTTPGVPNTGLGGGAQSIWLALIVSALVAMAGTGYLYVSRNPVALR
jgi:hypothetical protein